MARGLALAVVLLLVLAGPAAAASGTYTCATLPDGFAQVADGDVITLDGMCNQAYTLPDFGTPPGPPYKTWTLRGLDGNDGFDGSDLAGRVLTGNDVDNLTIDNLTFRDSDVTGNGGAIEITGESGFIIRRSTFLNNSATLKGGAVYVAPDAEQGGENLTPIVIDGSTFGSQANPLEGNTATTGGALAVDMTGHGDNSSYHDSFFYNNVATQNGGAFSWEQPTGGNTDSFDVFNNTVIGNKASGSGGGGYVVQPGSLDVLNEVYEGNSIDPAVGTPLVHDHFGGGLYLKHAGISSQSNNRFRSNEIKPEPLGQEYGGGGLADLGSGLLLFVNSQLSRFESNVLPAAPAGGSSEGGGLFVEGSGVRWYSFLDTFAGNSIGAGGAGGGIYVGAVIPTNTRLELGEVTVAGNSVGGGSDGAGIVGDPDDELIMRNSIVYNGPTDIGGFGSFDIKYSDACHQNPAFSAPGNICADPKLVGGADVHQTPQSPTIDKGNDELSLAEGGERNPEDYEGDPRPTDGDGDGHTVDMGADESPAFVAQTPVIPPPPPQCSDGADNDGDGAVDSADPGCLAGPSDNNEGDETQRDLILCGQRTISLVRADVKGSKVVLSGIVATSVAGQKVQLSVRYLGGGAKPQKLGSVTPGADGQFQARVKKPSRKLFNDARYRAQVGSAKSVELKLPQSLASSSLKQVAGGMLELRGQVDRTVLGKRNAVVIKRILCGKYTAVGQAKPSKKGAYAVRFPAPPSQGSALYRAETKVLARPGSKRYVKQFARAIGITF